MDYISKLSNDEKIALIFGCDEHQNQMTKKIRKEAKHHLDITGKRIKLSLDGEIGAVTDILSKTRKFFKKIYFDNLKWLLKLKGPFENQ